VLERLPGTEVGRERQDADHLGGADRLLDREWPRASCLGLAYRHLPILFGPRKPWKSSTRGDRLHDVPRRTVMVLALVLAASGASIAAAAHSTNFHDDFASFDTRQWTKSSRPFGYGAIDPANISVANGILGVKLPGGKLDGGEIRSTSVYTYGTFRARMKIANAPSSLTAFFLYKQPDYAQEIDIEIFNDSSRRVWFSTYSGGTQTHTVEMLLPFDATADFHEYAIERDRSSVRFLVDGVQMQSWASGVPRSSMYLYVNAWFPSWLAGESPASDRSTLVDWITYSGR
jgi:beta-glucanase (GH16 family)